MELQVVNVKDPPSRKAVSACQAMQNRFEDMKGELATREKLLEVERGNNAALKREIARLRTNARIADRRSALTAP
jgi:phage regulator Rha-like protein